MLSAFACPQNFVALFCLLSGSMLGIRYLLLILAVSRVIYREYCLYSGVCSWCETARTAGARSYLGGYSKYRNYSVLGMVLHYDELLVLLSHGPMSSILHLWSQNRRQKLESKNTTGNTYIARWNNTENRKQPDKYHGRDTSYASNRKNNTPCTACNLLQWSCGTKKNNETKTN